MYNLSEFIVTHFIQMSSPQTDKCYNNRRLADVEDYNGEARIEQCTRSIPFKDPSIVHLYNNIITKLYTADTIHLN